MRFCVVLLTKNLCDRFQILSRAIFPENIDWKEMALGLKIDKKQDKYQKALPIFLTSIIRRIIHSNKWTNSGNMNTEQISDRLAKMIVHESKLQVKNRYDLCIENDELAHFKKQCLLNGIIGKLRNDKVEWSALISGVPKRATCLFENNKITN